MILFSYLKLLKILIAKNKMPLIKCKLFMVVFIRMIAEFIEKHNSYFLNISNSNSYV